MTSCRSYADSSVAPRRLRLSSPSDRAFRKIYLAEIFRNETLLSNRSLSILEKNPASTKLTCTFPGRNTQSTSRRVTHSITAAR